MNRKKLRSFHAGVVKDINEQLVLRLIQENDIISSSELVHITGMRPSTVFNILKRLTEKNFVIFHGKGNSTDKGGKKPFMWSLNKNAAYVIGLDIEVNEMTCVILDFSGHIVSKKVSKLETGWTVDELVQSIIKFVNSMLSENKISHHDVLGLGVAFAGIVDFKKGIVVMSSVIPEMNFPLYDKLRVLPFPVLIENNANAAAIGLKWNGNDKTKRTYITALVEIDKNVSGLGIGLVIDGTLYRGTSFCAGELYPHLPSLLEILATVRSRFVESPILSEYSSSLESLDIEFLLEAAKNGDEIAEQIFTMIGTIIGRTIAPVVALLNPDTLIISGFVSELGDLMVKIIKRVIEMNVLSITCKSLSIVVDKYHNYSVAVGAASLILEDYFKLPKVQ